MIYYDDKMLNFTLTDLRYLVALAEDKHFARAAERSFVSQPTLSIAIKKLEENLGVNIFERQNHQIIITPSGEKIIAQAYKILNEASQLTQLAKRATNEYTEPIRIGAIFTIGPYIFPNLVKKVTKELPDLKLIIEENYTNTLIDKLSSGALDFIIIATNESRKEFIQIDLFKDELQLICSKQSKFAKMSTTIKQNHLAQETFLLLGDGHCLRDQIIEACPSSNKNINNLGHVITSSSLETIKYMVEMNLGISVLPKMAQNNLSENIIIKDFGTKKSSRTISIMFRNNYPHIKIANNLVNILKTLN